MRFKTVFIMTFLLMLLVAPLTAMSGVSDILGDKGSEISLSNIVPQGTAAAAVKAVSQEATLDIYRVQEANTASEVLPLLSYCVLFSTPASEPPLAKKHRYLKARFTNNLGQGNIVLTQSNRMRLARSNT